MSAVAEGAPAPRVARWTPKAAVAAIVIGLVVSQALGFAVVHLRPDGRAADEVLGAAVLLSEIPLLLVVVLFARRGGDRITAATLGFRRTPFWAALGWALAFYIGILGAEGLYLALVGNGSADHGSSHLGVAAAVMAVAGIALVAPIVEEVAFRGYLFPALTTWRGPWVAALGTAVLFAAAHVGAYPPLVAPAMLFFGFGACLLRWFTGSLLPCIGLHALNNGVVTAGVAGSFGGWLVAGSLLAPVVAVLLVLPFARERVASRG